MPTYPPILYVEDEENDVFLVRMACRRAAVPLPLEVVVNGQEALDYLEATAPDVLGKRRDLPCIVLLDLNLPLVHGLEVLQWIRAQERFRTLPVIVFTSSEQESDRTRACALGASDYIVKPSQMDQLVKIMESLKRTWLMHCLAAS